MERDDDESDERNELGDDTDEGDGGTELRKREEKRSASTLRASEFEGEELTVAIPSVA